MIYLKVGCNFEKQLIDIYKQLNNISSRIIISEVYGSLNICDLLTARPKFRLPSISKSYFEKYIQQLLDINVKFNYSLNSPYIGSKREINKKQKSIIDYLKYLKDIGVHSVTFSNPLIAEIVKENDININLELSTIAHIDTVTQAKLYFERYNIASITCNILKNRSIRFLTNLSSYCNNNNIKLFLIANEFCGNGSIDNLSASHCIYRDSCYISHSKDKTKEDALLFNNYPMQNCITSRANPHDWLKMRFIRPEDLSRYHAIGISHFKITGRTASTSFIKAITSAYMNEEWNGNLLSLWKPLETIYSNADELTFHNNIFIDNTKLNSFLNFWFDNPDFECANELCGVTCKYCDTYLNDI
jgi:collagenase-like PrtC family protease